MPEWCDRRGRNAWDLMAVVLAVRGPHRVCNTSVAAQGAHRSRWPCGYTLMPGYNQVDHITGQNTWTDEGDLRLRASGQAEMRSGNGRGHFEAWMDESNYSSVAAEIDRLLLRLPTATPPPGSPPVSPPSPPLNGPPPPPPPSPRPSPPPEPWLAAHAAASSHPPQTFPPSPTLPSAPQEEWGTSGQLPSSTVAVLLLGSGGVALLAWAYLRSRSAGERLREAPPPSKDAKRKVTSRRRAKQRAAAVAAEEETKGLARGTDS